LKTPDFIKNNLLLKITSFNSAAMSVRMVLAFISQKVIAVLLGPEGVAVLGNVRNVIPMISSFTTLGVFNGIVKYVAEYKNDKKELHQLFSTTAVYLLFGSIISFCVLFFGAELLNEWLFLGKFNFIYIFKILAVSVPFIALNRVFDGIMNGLTAYKKFVNINLITYAISILFLLIAVYFKNLGGALVAIAITPMIQFSIVAYFYFNTLKEYIVLKELKFVIPYKNKLVAFTLMSIVATFLGEFVNLKLRTHLMKNISEIDAGNWTGMTNISKQYLMFSSAILTLYVIPTFAQIKESKQFRKEVIRIYKTLLPLFAIGMLIVFFTREWVILIAKTKEFLGMMPLFKWQLLGDFVKVATIIIGHQFLAKRMVKQFIITELISLALFYGFSTHFIKTMGAEGIVLAHFIRYILYFIIVVYVLRKHLFGDNDLKEV